MRSSIKLPLLLLAVLPALTLAQAQDVPLRLGYQGRLLASDGTPLSGMKQITFSLFKTPTSEAGERPLWSETQQLALTNGYYATFLGATTSLGSTTSPLPEIFDGSDLYLGVAVGGTELSPRQRIGSVAYAMRAARAVNADHATRADSARAVDVGWLGAQSVAFASDAMNATNAANVRGGSGVVSAASVDAQTITANRLESRSEAVAVAVTTQSLNVNAGSTLRGTTVVGALNANSILHVRGAVVGGYRTWSTNCSTSTQSCPTVYHCEAWGDGLCSADNKSATCEGGSNPAGYVRGIPRSVGSMTLCIQE